MDFIDFDSYQETSAEGGANLPSPQPALSLPITTNIENLGKRFSNFNNLTRNLLKRDETSTKDTNYSKEIKIAEKYAKLSLNIIDKEETVLNESTGPIKHNSLSNRLSRVLNNQMNDSFIKEVFINLEDKYSDNLTSNNIKELIEPGVNGSISRKKLRGLIENELIKNQSSVLKEYSPTIKQLKVLQEKLVKLNELNNSTNEKIDKNYQLSSHFNSRIVDLNKEKKSIMLKKNLLINFKAKFTLDEYEEFVLSSGEINDEYFKVLQKAELINENCSILLSIDNPQLGLKIMSKINQIINKSIDKIVNFTNKSLGNLYSLNSKTKLTILQKCLKYLKNKMNYYNSIVANFTESRSKVLLDDFLNEIQVSSSGSKNSRPIFISAHDPIRFIGDLLAYIHSIVVNEIETISNIFLTDDNISKNNEILNKILKPLSKPIKSKIDEIISLNTKLSTLYSIYNLVELYTVMFSKQLSPENDILQTIHLLVKSSQDKIITIINNKLATIQSSNQAQLDLSIDLQPPEWIIDFYSDILPIIDQLNSDTILNLSTSDHEKFTSMIVNQPIDVFYHHISNNKLFTDKRDQLILKQNFLDLILSKIIPINLLSDKVLEINELNNNLVNEITSYQLDTLLKETQLYDYFNIINMICPFTDDFFDISIYEPIKENKLFSRDIISEVNLVIQDVLPNSLIDIQQSMMKLNSPLIVNDIVMNSSLEYVKFYYKFNTIIWEYLKEEFSWSDIEVATLLGVEDEYVEIRSSLME